MMRISQRMMIWKMRIPVNVENGKTLIENSVTVVYLLITNLKEMIKATEALGKLEAIKNTLVKDGEISETLDLTIDFLHFVKEAQKTNL